jgi:hypothetical protein
MVSKNKPPRLVTGAARETVRLGGSNSSDSNQRSNVVQLAAVVVDVETDLGEHGFHVRARHCGRLTYHRKSFGILSAARREADALAAARGWRVAS